MDTDFFRDKKIVIIICVLIVLLTAGGVIGGLILFNKPKEQPVLVETKEQEAARNEKNAQIRGLLDQMEDPELSNEERAKISDQIRSLDK